VSTETGGAESRVIPSPSCGFRPSAVLHALRTAPDAALRGGPMVRRTRVPDPPRERLPPVQHAPRLHDRCAERRRGRQPPPHPSSCRFWLYTEGRGVAAWGGDRRELRRAPRRGGAPRCHPRNRCGSSRGSGRPPPRPPSRGVGGGCHEPLGRRPHVRARVCPCRAAPGTVASVPPFLVVASVAIRIGARARTWNKKTPRAT